MSGTIHAGDTTAADAQAALGTAYADAAGRLPVTALAGGLLGGLTLAPGVYSLGAPAFNLTSGATVTLDGGGDPNAVFIFQASSSLITASSSTVALSGDAQACNVFWQVGSSATLGSGSTFQGTIMALTSVSLDTGATVEGRVLAQNGEVSLEDNDIAVPTCAAPATGGTTPSTTVTHVIDKATGGPPTDDELTGSSFHDTATVGPTGAAAIGDTVTYSYFTNGTCDGTPATQTVTISATGVVPNSATTGALGPGSYSFEATYSGDATYASSTSPCEPFRVLAPTPPPTTPPPTTPPPTTPPPTTPPPTTPPPTTPVTPVTTPFTPVTPPVTTIGPGGEVIPLGAPETGAGGASHSSDVVLVALGGVALIGAAAAMNQAIRRRRVLPARDGLGDGELGEDE